MLQFIIALKDYIMQNYEFLNKIPDNWQKVDGEELEKLGLIKSEEFIFLGAFYSNEQIIFFHQYPEIPNFLETLKEAYLNLFIYDKTSQKNGVSSSVFVELGEFKEHKFLFYVSDVENNLKLSLQIFCQTEYGNFGVITAIDFDKSLSFEKIVKIPLVNQIISLFV